MVNLTYQLFSFLKGYFFMKKLIGRPKIMIKDLPQDWVKKITDLAEVGGSDVEMRVALDCMSDDLWYRLIAEEEEFSRTVNKAKLIARAWWERNGRENLHNNKFNSRLWNLNMSNRFAWHEKKESSNETICFNCFTENQRKKYGIG